MSESREVRTGDARCTRRPRMRRPRMPGGSRSRSQPARGPGEDPRDRTGRYTAGPVAWAVPHSRLPPQKPSASWCSARRTPTAARERESRGGSRLGQRRRHPDRQPITASANEIRFGERRSTRASLQLTVRQVTDMLPEGGSPKHATTGHREDSRRRPSRERADRRRLVEPAEIVPRPARTPPPRCVVLRSEGKGFNGRSRHQGEPEHEGFAR